MQYESTATSAALASVDDEIERNDYPWGTNPDVVTAIQCRFSITTRLAGKLSVPNVSLTRQNQLLICGSAISLSEKSRPLEETY